MVIDPEVAPGLEPAPQNKMEGLMTQTDGVIKIVKESVGRLFERKDNLEDLENLSKELKNQAEGFSLTAKKVERSYCLKNVKLVVVIVAVVLVIILVVVLLATGVIPVGSPPSTSTPPPIPPIPTTPKP